jgi:hypothetical protein
VWIAAGIQGIGTQGAANLLVNETDALSGALAKRNMSLSDTFVALVSVERTASGLLPTVVEVYDAGYPFR